MKILPIAADSLGARSMATLVETPDIKIGIDFGVSLGPVRYNLPPHPKEIAKLKEFRKRIINFASEVDILVITHYHYDHYMPDYPEIYRGKVVYLKDPDSKSSNNQRNRGKEFLKILEDIGSKFRIVDGQVITHGSTRIRFSPPVSHGTEKGGSVLMVWISVNKENLLFSSDIMGSFPKEMEELVEKDKPTVGYFDGPDTLYSSENKIKDSAKALKVIAKYCNIAIFDHHLTRDRSYKEKLDEIFRLPNTYTVASYLGEKEELLEGKRDLLFAE